MEKSMSSEIFDKETKEIFDLMEQYKESMKQLFICNKKTITHITSVSPKNL